MSETNAPTVLLVGHCSPDAMMLQSAIRRVVEGAGFAIAMSMADLEERLPGASVALVNRVLDGDFGGADGLGLIRRFAGGGAGTPMMLISNFAESQQEAEAAGAVPGFGKSDLYAAQTGERLLAAIVKGRSGA